MVRLDNGLYKKLKRISISNNKDIETILNEYIHYLIRLDYSEVMSDNKDVKIIENIHDTWDVFGVFDDYDRRYTAHVYDLRKDEKYISDYKDDELEVEIFDVLPYDINIFDLRIIMYLHEYFINRQRFEKNKINIYQIAEDIYFPNSYYRVYESLMKLSKEKLVFEVDEKKIKESLFSVDVNDNHLNELEAWITFNKRAVEKLNYDEMSKLRKIVYKTINISTIKLAVWLQKRREYILKKYKVTCDTLEIKEFNYMNCFSLNSKENILNDLNYLRSVHVVIEDYFDVGDKVQIDYIE